MISGVLRAILATRHRKTRRSFDQGVATGHRREQILRSVDRLRRNAARLQRGQCCRAILTVVGSPSPPTMSLNLWLRTTDFGRSPHGGTPESCPHLKIYWVTEYLSRRDTPSLLPSSSRRTHANSNHHSSHHRPDQFSTRAFRWKFLRHPRYELVRGNPRGVVQAGLVVGGAIASNLCCVIKVRTAFRPQYDEEFPFEEFPSKSAQVLAFRRSSACTPSWQLPFAARVCRHLSHTTVQSL